MNAQDATERIETFGERIERVIMHPALWFAIALLCAVTQMCGCATLDRSLKAADKGLAILDVTITETTEVYDAATTAAIRRCAQEIIDDDEARRHDCLARQGFSPEQIEKVEQAIEQIRDAYDMMADALGTIRKTLPLLREAENNAKAVLQ